MTGDINLLTNLKSINAVAISLPDGGVTWATRHGTLNLGGKLILHNVFYAPQLSVTLISVSQLLNEIASIVIFTKQFCVIQDLASRTLIGAGEEAEEEQQMLTTCRSLFRIDRVLGFTSRCLKSKQERFSLMSFSGNAAMDGSKKQKMVNSVWRPISTQSSSLVNSEGQCSKSSGVSEEVNERGVNETASVVSDEKHSVSLQVGASLMKFIRGKEGTTQMKIEEEMGVKIIFPSSRNEDYIIIEGGSVDCVTKASERIATIIDEVVKSPSLDYSHFVSLPLAIHPELVGKLVNFQNSILGNQSIAVDETTSVAVDLKETKSSTLFDLGIEKSIFIKPSTFHLTVLMLKLWNKDRVNTARDVLKSISPSVMDALDNRPLFIRLKGLDCMRGSLAKARVLYIPVEEIGDEGRLLRACKVITDAFVKAGLVLEKDANQSLKLHATVMNARHRKRKDKRKKLDTFDAREIHKQFGNEDWGEYLIQEAHLSQRFVFDQSGYYRCCASIQFPENTETEKKH